MDTRTAELQILAWYLVLRRRDPRSSVLRPEHFAGAEYRGWWAKALERPESVLADLPNAALAALSDVAAIPSDREVAELERRLVDGWSRRHLLGRVESAMKRRDADLHELTGALRQAISEAEAGCLSESRTHAEVGVDLFRDWSDSCRSDHSGPVVPMPLRRLQEIIGGWRRGKLWMVEAITSGHKTTFARMAAWHAAKCGEQPLMWAMEDSSEQIVQRTWAAEIREVDTRTFQMGQKPPVTEDEFAMVLDKLGRNLESDAARRLRIRDEGMPKLSRVLGLCSSEVARGCTMIVLDFFQLIQPDERPLSEEGHWYNCANSLQALAKDLDVPILCTCQPTQSAQRAQLETGKSLTISDIRGAAAISQAAWGILILNAAGNSDQDSRAWVRNPRKIEIVTAKNKAGPRGDGTFTVLPEHDLITDDR
jgi:replicative DNA helicase